MGLFLGWQIDKVCLYPYGGVTKFNEDINRKLSEELLILITGPIFQIIYFIVGIGLFKDNSFNYYNLSILIFNLLPMYPLDGGRILNIIFCYFFSFRFSFYLSIIISFIVSILFIIYSILNNYTFNIILMFLVVIGKIIVEVKKKNFYFNKFLLERHLNHYEFKKVINISSIKKMMRDKRHIILFNSNYITEKEYLKKLYR